MHAHTLANSIFDGAITRLLSLLCILIEIRSGARANKGKQALWFQIWHFYLSFSERPRGKHNSGRVNVVFLQSMTRSDSLQQRTPVVCEGKGGHYPPHLLFVKGRGVTTLHT